MVKFIHSLKILPRWIIILIDLGIFFFSVVLAYFLRFNFDLSSVQNSDPLPGILVYFGFGALALFVTGLYTGIIRYTSMQDGLRIVYTTSLTLVLVLITNYIFRLYYSHHFIPVSVVIISYFSSLIFLFYYRFAVKYIFSYYTQIIQKKINVVIFGAGKFGQATKHIIEHDRSFHFKVVAFMEDDPHKVGKSIEGVKIFDARKKLSHILKSCNAREVIISIQHLSLDRKNEIVDECLQNNVKVRTVPPVEKWVRGELSMKQIQELRIEDLLGRASIKLDNHNIRQQMVGKSIMITGAAGSIGGEIVRQALTYQPDTIILVDQAETPLFEIGLEINKIAHSVKIIYKIADVANLTRMERIFEEYQPHLVYHAAAYKHVPVMENNPSEAIICNILGTKILADLSIKYAVETFVMVSTDKAVNPTNIMGASKRIAEIYVQALSGYLIQTLNHHTRFITTRFGNVLGSNGSVIPLFTKQIKEGGPITITHPDICRYFMTIPEACQLVLEAGAMGKGGEIYIFDMGKSIKIVDLARKMVQLSGLQLGKDIDIAFTGLREGEKLYEEMLDIKENTIPTHHPKILIAKVRAEKFSLVSQQIDDLIKSTSSNDEFYMVSLMKELVPEFISNFSRFEELDQKRLTV
jgi:FlaA1/EpsC-like NDP-sugar epimerase